MELNLPKYSVKVCRENGMLKIHDRIRMKFVALTPEEWVRQHFVNHLIENLGYPASLIANEIGLTLNGTRRRCDSVVFNNSGKPMVIIEYKAPEVAISQKVFDQIVRYNMVLHADYLFVSNGMTHYCCSIDYTTGRYAFLQEIPPYASL
ncbi:type I restriction enzyme HsdR N-terminal domain-containing protein [uncultured Muribaculum sp.]|uniref:type I restriction enzyme HsdR N-terminal domain-containing protein n=1 Tax=uncultured Muribaculum sp. TaxID=1918613 RepID=UPI002596041C|nr:type I restriction enzyme HsdR N-terminal domain-containing protein [uncultured Muribaculum sp.]